jgi:TPR repeat protein
MSTLRQSTLAAGLLLAALFPAPADDAKGKKYALVIGIKEYKHASLPALRFTENDAEELARVLGKPSSGFAVRLLTTTRGGKDPKDAPTTANIEKALNELLDKKGKHDMVLIALAGHGIQLEVDPAKGKRPSRSFGYFCPSDADFGGVSFATGKAPRLIGLHDVLKRLGLCGAGSRLLLVDACRNQAKVGSARSIDPGALSAPKGVAALFSCDTGQRAWETDKLGKGHGVFFYHVIAGLEGKARVDGPEISWDDLSRHVRKVVGPDVARLIGGGARQDPHSIANQVGTSPILARVTLPRKNGKGARPRKNDPEFLYRQGRELIHGRGTDRLQYSRGAQLLEKAADKGHALAQGRLAHCYSVGLGVKVDHEAAKRLAARALATVKASAEKGDADSCTVLGYLYLADRESADRPRVEAFRWLLRAAEKGEAEAQAHVGRVLLLGGVRPKDPKSALGWLEKAAAQNNAAALLQLSQAYITGKEVAKDEKKGLDHLHKAADLFHPEAMRVLGGYYEAGEHVKMDEKEALRLYIGAAEQGAPSHMNHLANFYLYRAPPALRNEKEALRWYRKAAEQDLLPAQVALGKMLLEKGGPKNEKEALAWLTKAAGRGSKEAAALLKKQKRAAGGRPRGDDPDEKGPSDREDRDKR